MSAARYVFASEWTVAAGAQRVYDVLEDVASYPQWWPQVRAVARLSEDRALVACRSVLPYTLHVELVADVRDRAAGVLRGTLDGDLVGHSAWRLTATGEGTRLRYEQEVHTPSAALRAAGRVARPLLVANHAAMMRGALRGLAGRTAR